MQTNTNFQRLLEELTKLGDEAFRRPSDDLVYQEFINAFPADQLPHLSLADYCIGKGGKSSFCWWLERGLENVLGRYMPGTARGHLLYFLRDGTVYKHGELKTLSDKAALEYTLRIQAVIAKSDPTEDLRWVDDDQQLYQRAGVDERVTVAPGRKLRLLSCYHPEDTLPISSPSHLGHYLEVLGLPSADIPPEDQPVARMLALRDYFNLALDELPNLTTSGFMKALYSDRLGLRPAKERDKGDDEQVGKSKARPDGKGGTAVVDVALGFSSSTDLPLNQILYGPPGTGKTFATVDAALEILDPAFRKQNLGDRTALKGRFDALSKEKPHRVRFVTFHQSFSYEDFVEGIRAEPNEKNLKYSIESGIFKKLCDDARPTIAADPVVVLPNARIWKISIAGTGPSSTKEYCFSHDEARVGWGRTGDLKQNPKDPEYYESLGKGDRGTLSYFADEIAVGDILLCIHSANAIAAVGVVTGDYRFESAEDLPPEVLKHYQHVRPVKWLYKNLGLPIGPLNANRQFTAKTVYQMPKLSWADLQRFLESHGCVPVDSHAVSTSSPLPFVLIIDEINRGSISRIFGELITLIEPSKRSGASEEVLEVLLPYSKKAFSVPSNVFLVGTMNTADRSLAAMDVALRRRFVFKEMPPRPELLDAVNVGSISIGKLLTVMNQRIEALLDRDHCLGHALFWLLRDKATIAQLAEIFRGQVIPLLQEYFYNDWQRIQWVLNDHRKPDDAYRFIKSRELNAKSLFGDGASIGRTAQLWQINEDAFLLEQSYLGIIDHQDVTE